MISCNLKGGLGNQMFQIAATYALAKRNNDSAVFNFESCFTPLQGSPSMRYKDTVFKNITNGTPECHAIYYEPTFGYSEIPYMENMKLDGYFQSEKYFEDCKTEILDLFKFDESEDRVIKYLSNFKRPTTSIHVRRGDYIKLSDVHHVCPVEYFLNAMKLLKHNDFIFISDDMEWVKNNFKGKNIFYSPFDNEIDDLTLSMNCNNNIIANSSFSWWGAYLNKKSNKKVIVPKIWFGKNGPKDTDDLIPENWLTIDYKSI